MSTHSSVEGDASGRSGEAPAARLPKSGRGPRPDSGNRERSRPAASASPSRRPARTTPRRVRLTLSRVDPWSVMKIAFLLSVSAAIAGVVMVAVMWTVLSGMGVFESVQEVLNTLNTPGEAESPDFDIMDYIGFGRVVSLAVVIGVIDIVLLTAVATLAAFLYNVCASLVGGVQLTLSDE